MTDVQIDYLYPDGGGPMSAKTHLPYAETRVEPAQLEGDRQPLIDLLVEELSPEVGIGRAERGTLHVWDDTNGMCVVRLVAEPWTTSG